MVSANETTQYRDRHDARRPADDSDTAGSCVARSDAHKLRSMASVRAFVAAPAPATQPMLQRDAAYRFIGDTLRRFGYNRCDRADKGTLRTFLMQVTGFSRSQITRLISQHNRQGSIRDHRGAPTRPFPKRYTEADLQALADLDGLHGQLSGPITRKLCQRAWARFGEVRFQRLATISNGHLYNLRRTEGYRQSRGDADKGWWQRMPTGGDCRRRSDGRPGRLYVGLCRRGDLDAITGLHHIDIVDAETKYQFIASVPRISPDCLLPLLHGLRAALPFAIRSVHADGGREPRNKRIAEQLTQLLHIEHAPTNTRTTPVPVCKRWPDTINAYTGNVLSPYLNYHRLRMFAVAHTETGGRVRKTYPYAAIATPYERLKSLPDARRYLQPGLDFAQLDQLAYADSDNAAAQQLDMARSALLSAVTPAQISAA